MATCWTEDMTSNEWAALWQVKKEKLLQVQVKLTLFSKHHSYGGMLHKFNDICRRVRISELPWDAIKCHMNHCRWNVAWSHGHRRRSGWNSGEHMASAEGGLVPSGARYGEGCLLPSRLEGLGECCEISQRGTGQSPGRKWILAYFEGHRMLFCNYMTKYGGGDNLH